MVLHFITDSPEYHRKVEQLQLARQHAQEWRFIFALEKATRTALEIGHQAEMRQSRLTLTYQQQAVIVNRQLQQLKGLQQEHKLVREAIRARQSQEKAEIILSFGK